MSEPISTSLASAHGGDKVNIELPYPMDGTGVSYPMFARNGLYVTLSSIATLTDARTVLLPAYTCGDEIETVIRAGYKVVPYSIDNQLQAVIEDIESLVGDDTAAIMLTHYFGFPQDGLKEIATLAKKKGIFLLEDCAHVLSSVTYDGLQLGTVGDASFFSLRKYFPIPHGGVLVINNQRLQPPTFKEPDGVTQDKDLLIFLAQTQGLLRKGTPITEIYERVGLRSDGVHGPRYPDSGGYQLGMTKLSMLLLSNTNWRVISENHCERFQQLLSLCDKGSVSIQPIFNHLPPKCTPLVFPVNITNSHNRIDRRIPEINPYWTFLHPQIDLSRNKIARFFKEHLGVISLDEPLKCSDG